jgi:muramoyltetrapeptide carboxypeptidase LdcA involved in peptidoglycan recycling
MMQTLKSPALKKGATIGIVATSFPFPDERLPDAPYMQEYKRGIKELERMGFQTKEGKNIRKVKWWFAGTPEERAADINAMFADPEVKAIMVHEGGQSAIALLEHIDYELVKKHPKPFIGFSDITNIHCALFTKTGLIGFHGPLLTYSLGRVWEEFLPQKKAEGKALLFNALTSTDPLGVIMPLTPWECWRAGKASGQLFGGNLSMLASLVGTEYFPRLEALRGCILFWEIDNTESYRIEKGLYQLKYAGILDVIAGMLIGKLPDIKRTAWSGFEEPTPKEIVMEVMKKYSFPIIGEVDFGHKTVDIPMPIGIRVEMDAQRRHVAFLEAATCMPS